MPAPIRSSIRQQLASTIGPAPWYWKTFPTVRSPSGRKLVWAHHGDQGPLGYVVTLGLESEMERPLLALNTYCRPFALGADGLGVWCPEGRNLRLCAFDLDHLKPFDLSEIAGWFKQSGERIYSAAAPAAECEVPVGLAAGTHKIVVPAALAQIDELIAPTSYRAMSNDDPAFALFVLYLRAGLVEVLPQQWFTAAQYQIGPQWISRAARDPDSHRIFGECFGAGTFLLEEGGCRLAEWVEKVA